MRYKRIRRLKQSHWRPLAKCTIHASWDLKRNVGDISLASNITQASGTKVPILSTAIQWPWLKLLLAYAPSQPSSKTSTSRTTYCPVGWGCRIHWLHLCREVIPHNACPGYDTKQSDGSSNSGASGNAEHPFIAIPPRSSLAWNGNTW